MKYSRFLCGNAFVAVMIRALNKTSFVEIYNVSWQKGEVYKPWRMQNFLNFGLIHILDDS